MKLLQKIGAVLLCMCMLIPMMPETAWAAQDPLSEVHVNIELPKVGIGEQKVIYTAVEEEKYEIICEQTAVLDGSSVGDYWWGVDYAIATEFAGYGNGYIAKFTVIPNGNYGLTENTKVYVNGKETGVNLVGGNNSPASEFTFTTEVADPVEISNIELTNVPTGEIGDAATRYEYDGDGYSVVGIWSKYDDTQKSYIEMNETEKFEQGQMYDLALFIETDRGYWINESNGLDVIINDESVYVSDYYQFGAYPHMYVNYVEEIDTIEISSANLPKAEIGKTFTDTVINIPVAEGSPYTVSGRWMYIDDEYMESYEGTFKEGEEYYFEMTFNPKEGYCFGEDCYFYYDEVIDWDYEYRNPAKLEYDARVSLKKVIDKLTLLNLPVATVGGSAKTGEFAVEVPEGAPYTATAIWWISTEDYNWDDVTTTTFEDGNKYRIYVSIEPKEGYEFAESTIVNAYGVDVKVYNGSADWTWFEKDFSLLTEISSIEITGYTEPVVGANATVDGLKVPADANYEIVNAFWYEDVAENAGGVTVFEKGKDYALYISLEAKQGYEFSSDVVVTLNGEVIDFYLHGTGMDAYKDVSFKEVITDVQISNLPIMEIGKQATTDIKVPDGVNYKAEAFWYVWDDAEEEWTNFLGTFETGKVYELYVYVSPNAGYRFSEDATTFTVEDKEYEDAHIWSNDISLSKFYQTEHKVIDRVELKIEEPVVGNHASIAPVITIVGDANFTVIDNEGDIYWLTGTADDNYLYDEYFVVDETYGVSFIVRANTGYVFSEDMVIVINGKVIPEEACYNTSKELYISYFFGMGTEEVVDDGTAGGTGDSTVGGTDERNTVPKTGDAFNVGMYVSILLLGMFAVSGALASRRRSVR